MWFQEIVGRKTLAEAEVLECVLRHMRNKRDAKKTTSLKKWLVMKHKIDGYNASLCQTSWLTSLGCPAGVSLSLSIYPSFVAHSICQFLIFCIKFLMSHLFHNSNNNVSTLVKRI